MKEMDDMKKKEKGRKRMAALVEAGFDQEEAEETLAAFDSVNDEAFDVIVAKMYDKMKAKKDKKEDEAEAAMPPALKEALEKKKKEKEAKADEEAEAEVTPELLEDVETSEATLVDATPDVDEVETTRASISDWLSNNVLSTK
jgi:hypothetical protein